MDAVTPDRDWPEAAVAGSPDILIHLHQQSITWKELWELHREPPGKPGAVLALTGYFHAAMSLAYDQEGSVLERDGRMYPQLREWARFVVGVEVAVPESRVRDSLAGLLAVGLVSRLYYQVVFSLYLEACLERQWERGLRGGTGPRQDWITARPLPKGRLPLRWPQQPAEPVKSGESTWVEALSSLVEQHYAGWNGAYCLALGADAGDEYDEGGEG